MPKAIDQELFRTRGLRCCWFGERKTEAIKLANDSAYALWGVQSSPVIQTCPVPSQKSVDTGNDWSSTSRQTLRAGNFRSVNQEFRGYGRNFRNFGILEFVNKITHSTSAEANFRHCACFSMATKSIRYSGISAATKERQANPLCCFDSWMTRCVTDYNEIPWGI